MAIDVRSRLGITDEALAEFCRKWKIVLLELFGSALREDFSETSDIDLMVTFQEEADWDFSAHLEMQEELESLLCRKVDMPERKLVEKMENWIRRKDILRSARTIFQA